MQAQTGSRGRILLILNLSTKCCGCSTPPHPPPPTAFLYGPIQARRNPRGWGSLNLLTMLSGLRTGRLYPPGNIPGTHFCWRLSGPQDSSAAKRIQSMKNSNDSMGNRTHDFPICSSVSQPTVPPHKNLAQLLLRDCGTDGLWNVTLSYKNICTLNCTWQRTMSWLLHFDEFYARDTNYLLVFINSYGT